MATEKQILEGLVKLGQSPLLPETTDPENNYSLPTMQDSITGQSPLVLALMQEHPNLSYEQIDEMLEEM